MDKYLKYKKKYLELKYNQIGKLKGKIVDKNFKYDSNTNNQKLSIEELKKLINE